MSSRWYCVLRNVRVQYEIRLLKHYYYMPKCCTMYFDISNIRIEHYTGVQDCRLCVRCCGIMQKNRNIQAEIKKMRTTSSYEDFSLNLPYSSSNNLNNMIPLNICLYLIFNK